MSFRESFYEGLIVAGRPLMHLVAPFNRKVRQGLRGRRVALMRLAEWSFLYRDRERPLVWFHAPSVGEGLMAQAIIGALRKRRPGVQVAFTHFSPSAERLAEKLGADVNAYLPWDMRYDVRRALDFLRPNAIAFVRTEVWPVLTREARLRKVHMALVNAVLPEGSSRLGPGARVLLEPVYRRLEAVGAVSEDHAARYTRMGVPAGRVQVTGDARFDQVWQRAESLGLRSWRAEIDVNGRSWEIVSGRPGDFDAAEGARQRPLFRLLHDPGATTLVAGSTWPGDERVVVPAFAAAARTGRARMIIAPHEPTEAHVAALERRLDHNGLSHARLTAMEMTGRGQPEVVVVDRMGVLAELYALASAAYVGGGFHSAGLHSVVEPAALGVPVLFGPGHGNAREAGELLAAGGAAVVETPADLKGWLLTFQSDPEARRRMGLAAEAYVRSQLGAADRNAQLILDLLS